MVTVLYVDNSMVWRQVVQTLHWTKQVSMAKVTCSCHLILLIVVMLHLDLFSEHYSPVHCSC